MEPTRLIDEHRAALTAARAALEGLGPVLHSAFNDELAELLTELDALVTAGSGMRAEVVLEAKRRGTYVEQGRDTREWVVEHAPSLRQSGAGQLAKIVDTVARRTGITAGCDYSEPGAMFNPDSPMAIVWGAVRSGEAAPPLALAILREMDQLEHRIKPEALPTVTEGMLVMGIGFGAAAARDLRMRILAEYGRNGAVEEEQRRLVKDAFLSAPMPESGELTRYTMGLTPEQTAVLEAALGPLAKPEPNDETGERDLRSNGQRRAEALTELCRRMATVDAERKGGPAGSDACVYVTVSLEDLQSGSGAGEVISSRADGVVLGMATLRTISCDADLIPIVLGTDGAALDHGRAVRWFTRAQRRGVWHRDRHCTFPGCSAPGSWTKVHHVRHWLDGGPTDMSNAALLCQRHHTFVHKKRLWADVRSTPDDQGRYVIWDLTPGSYDWQALQQGWSRGWDKAA